MTTAVLIQAHKNSNYILTLCKAYPDVNFYAHIDLKSEKEFFILNENKPNNLSLINNRYNVYWAGISQVKATLSLLSLALKDKENKYFHLMSSECLPLKGFNEIELEWEQLGNINFIDRIYNSKPHMWRLRAYGLHNDTKYLRTFWGRVLSKFLKIRSFFYDSHNFKDDEKYFGSQWFSLNRDTVEYIISQDFLYLVSRYERVFCADEHFFQIITRDFSSYCGNKRYITWGKGANSPNYLSKSEIKKIPSEYWFARKVKQELTIDLISERIRS
ncbi:beta-1,6-N-acetylglucosaminyltransferase [Pectobacterium sp. CHL-2024]|uniref:beta-1,6-N-acetylglucosaminyltransferase n=1 Tax=Pectobacterium sp. CHL-2024 TaxID=3377079 RepID=UPI003815978F